MALYQKYTFSNIATFLGDLAAFALSNGWTVITNTSTRAEISKEGLVFRVDYLNTSSVRMYATHPGGTINTSTVTIESLSSGQYYMFISCGGTIYIGRTLTGVWYWGGLINVVEKTGGWTGGAMLSGTSTASMLLFTENVSQSTLWINGAWSYLGSTPQVGSIKGSSNMMDTLVNKQPFRLNAGILPVPIKLYSCNATTSLLHPIGKAPGIFRFNAGNVYTVEEIIPIDGVDHLVMPYGASAVGTRDLLFRLSA